MTQEQSATVKAITYCAVNPNHHHPATPSRLCKRCEEHTTEALREIPDLYATLPGMVEHGTTEKNPDSATTKAAVAPAPMRLEIIDLLDTRLARKWLGTATTDERRGVYGILHAIASNIHDGRNLSGDLPANVSSACAYISRHMLWLTEQEWVDETADELRTLSRRLKDAVGIYRRRPVGRCHIVDDDDARCDGPLFASDYAGVHCARCDTVWGPESLRLLGLAQQEVRLEDVAG